jgi:hypothetical protein
MVMEGADTNIWSFGDKAAQARLIKAYHEEQPIATATEDHGQPAEKATVAQSPEKKAAATDADAPIVTASLPPKSPFRSGGKPIAPRDSEEARGENEAPHANGSEHSPWTASLASLPPPEKAPADGDPATGNDEEKSQNPWTTFTATVKESFAHSPTRH